MSILVKVTEGPRYFGSDEFDIALWRSGEEIARTKVDQHMLLNGPDPRGVLDDALQDLAKQAGLKTRGEIWEIVAPQLKHFLWRPEPAPHSMPEKECTNCRPLRPQVRRPSLRARIWRRLNPFLTIGRWFRRRRNTRVHGVGYLG